MTDLAWLGALAGLFLITLGLVRLIDSDRGGLE